MAEFCARNGVRVRCLQDVSCVDGLGGEVWAGAYLMADWLKDRAELVARRSVVELGCGTGYAGLAAAALGAARVCLTDEFVDLAERNRALNVVDGDLSEADVRCESFLWSDPLPAGVSADVVIGSEVTYNEKEQPDLVRALALLLDGKRRRCGVFFVDCNEDGSCCPSAQRFCDLLGEHDLEIVSRDVFTLRKCPDILYARGVDGKLKHGYMDGSERGAILLIRPVEHFPAGSAGARSNALRLNGNSMLREGRVEAALELYRQASAADPQSVPALNNCAAAYLRLRRPLGAIVAANRALRLEPANGKAAYRRGRARLMQLESLLEGGEEAAGGPGSCWVTPRDLVDIVDGASSDLVLACRMTTGDATAYKELQRANDVSSVCSSAVRQDLYAALAAEPAAASKGKDMTAYDEDFFRRACFRSACAPAAEEDSDDVWSTASERAKMLWYPRFNGDSRDLPNVLLEDLTVAATQLFRPNVDLYDACEATNMAASAAEGAAKLAIAANALPALVTAFAVLGLSKGFGGSARELREGLVFARMAERLCGEYFDPADALMAFELNPLHVGYEGGVNGERAKGLGHRETPFDSRMRIDCKSLAVAANAVCTGRIVYHAERDKDLLIDRPTPWTDLMPMLLNALQQLHYLYHKNGIGPSFGKAHLAAELHLLYAEGKVRELRRGPSPSNPAVYEKLQRRQDLRMVRKHLAAAQRNAAGIVWLELEVGVRTMRAERELEAWPGGGQQVGGGGLHVA